MKQQKKALVVWIGVVLVLLIAALLAGSPGREGVSSGLVFAFTVTAVLLVAAGCIRMFVIPRFQYTPGKLQLLLEEGVELSDGAAQRGGRTWRRFLRVIAGIYKFIRFLGDVAKQHKKAVAVWLGTTLALLLGALLVGSPGREESVQETMRDAVLHEANRISLFGVKDVSPGLISAFAVTALLLAGAAFLRAFVIPRFQYHPGKLQLLLEEAVGLFDGMARGSSPQRNRFLGVYIFAAGAYIFFGTLFELLGIQVPSTGELPITLPAPLSDVNAAIAMGTLSYLVILSGGIASNGIRGVGKTLKEYSLPISMSFRLFGALLSGLLVTELVYYYVNLSFVLPVVVGVMFTLLHALIQAYVLTMLTAMYYGEVSEREHPTENVQST